MDVRNNLEGLKSLLGVNTPGAAPAGPQSHGSAATSAGTGLDGDQATVSSAANQIAQTATDEGVRTDKVAQVQAALAAGTYNVPASAVASKLVDAMLNGQS